jgi:hypothetical protein
MFGKYDPNLPNIGKSGCRGECADLPRGAARNRAAQARIPLPARVRECPCDKNQRARRILVCASRTELRGGTIHARRAIHAAQTPRFRIQLPTENMEWIFRKNNEISFVFTQKRLPSRRRFQA